MGYNARSAVAARIGIGRGFLRVAAIVLVATAAIGLGYSLFGHTLIAKAYSGDLPAFLNRLIEGRSEHPLSYFLARADRAVYTEVLPFPILNLAFYYLMYRLFASLLKRSRSPRPALPPGRIIRHDWAVALAIYAICTCIFFSGHLASFGTRLIGPPEDNQKQYWNMWYAEKAISQGLSLGHTDLILFPEGTPDLFQDYSWYNLAVSFVLTPVFGRVAAYNLLILHSFLLAGLAGFLLVRYLVMDSLAAMAGGLVFAFNPSHFAHSLHHMNVSTIQFIPLFALFLVRALRHEGRWSWLLAAAFLAASALGHVEYLVLGFFFIAACYIYLALTRGEWFLPGEGRTMAAVFGVASAALAPLLIDTFRAIARHPWFLRGGHGDFAADLAGLVVPHYWHLLGRLPIVKAANLSYRGNLWESTAYLGVVAVAILAVHRRRLVKEWAPYFAGMIAFTILALGTYVNVLGYKVQIILPFSILKHVPILSQVRTPGRLMVFVYLLLAVLIGAFVREMSERRTASLARVALISAVIVLLLVDYLPLSREATPVDLPPCYEAILRDHPGSAILDLPGGYENSLRYMAYQTRHGLPIVQGELPRKFEPTLADRMRWDDLEVARSELVENRVRYLVIHKDLLSRKDSIPVDAMRARYAAVYEDAADLVFEMY